MFDSLRPHGPTRLFCPWDSEYWSRLPFPSLGDLPTLPALQVILYCLSHQGSPLLKGCPHQFSPLSPYSSDIEFPWLTVFPTSIKVSFSSDLHFFPFYYLLIMISHIKCFSHFSPIEILSIAQDPV